MKRWFLPWILAVLTACGTESVTLAIDFPSERAFILTETAEVEIFAAESCSEALTRATSDSEISLRHASGGVCALRAGEIVIDSVPHGSIAFVVLGFNSAVSQTEPILRGCRMITIGDSPPAVVPITLDFTDDYFPYEASVLASGGPGCSTADALCDGSCTP
jgi:hypothetical protein